MFASHWLPTSGKTVNMKNTFLTGLSTMTKEKIISYKEQLIERYPALECCSENLMIAYSILENCFFNDSTVFVCGNGGSASDAEHIVGELMKGFRLKRELDENTAKKFKDILGKDEDISLKLQNGIRSISLTGHPALSTAFMNDVDPLMTFAQQLYVMGRKGDVIIGLSTSGNAENILRAFKVARVKGIKTILMTGMNNGKCEKYSDCIIKAPSYETYIVQEYHLPIYHTLCMMIEERFYGKQQ